MFDGNSKTYWHGASPVTERNAVTVIFNDSIEFEKLKITARHDTIYEQKKYQNIKLYVDGVEEYCTKSDRHTNAGEIITLPAKAPKLAKNIEILFPEGFEAECGSFEIVYKGNKYSTLRFEVAKP